MVNLHYENLPNLDISPNFLMKKAYYELNDYLRYIGLSKDWMWSPERLKKVRWWPVSNPKVKNGKVSAQIGCWVRIDDSSSREGADLVEEFCNANNVIETPTRGSAWLRVLDSDLERGLLLLEKAPSSKEHILYLPPNSHVLERQQGALNRLRELPEPEHRGLLRLVEDPQRSKWPGVTPVSVEKWAFLTNPEIEGTDEQRRFVEIALGTPDFAILEGPPGSGKTTAICELIVQEVRLGHRVMLCASTHVAVDNVLESLQERGITSSEVIAVRIGDQKLISEKVRDFQLQQRAQKERRDLVRKLCLVQHRASSEEYFLEALQNSDDSEGSLVSRIILQSANLVCGTTIGILQHPDIKSWTNGKKSENGDSASRSNVGDVPKFDCLILDEASKTTFQEFLVPALFAKRWILVGDVKQLSPYVEKENVEDNLKSMIKEQEAAVCFNVFQCWEASQKSVQGLLLIDCPDSANYITQAGALGLNVLDLTKPHLKEDPLEFFGAHVIACSKADLPKIGKFVPSDMTVLPFGGTPEIERRHAYWLSHHASEGINLAGQDSISSWSRNLAWRVARSFEHRSEVSDALHDDTLMRNLLPRWFNEADQNNLMHCIETVKRVALPSILELLQKGFGRRTEGSKGSCLTDGLPSGVLMYRFVRLSYQHRMHPEISKFPREKIYDSESLKDPHRMEELRTWTYHRYKSRAGWIQTILARSPDQEMNEAEAEIIIRELKTFMSWAATNTKNSGPDQKKTWTVAILTFYRKQESLLRKRLQQLFRMSSRTHFASPDKSVEISLCTVDRFQGHEADLVLISFVRSRGAGFLDSLNRLNVAITRARYQLVLVGNQQMFTGIKRETLLLKKLAALDTFQNAWDDLKVSCFPSKEVT